MKRFSVIPIMIYHNTMQWLVNSGCGEAVLLLLLFAIALKLKRG